MLCLHHGCGIRFDPRITFDVQKYAANMGTHQALSFGRPPSPDRIGDPQVGLRAVLRESRRRGIELAQGSRPSRGTDHFLAEPLILGGLAHEQVELVVGVTKSVAIVGTSGRDCRFSE
jgi:hypothetical protein